MREPLHCAPIGPRINAGPATLKLNLNHVLENHPADEPESARESLSGWGLWRLEV
jgi:hypothetical protein